MNLTRSVVDTSFKVKLQDSVMEFSQKYMAGKRQQKQKEDFISKKLKEHFDD